METAVRTHCKMQRQHSAALTDYTSQQRKRHEALKELGNGAVCGGCVCVCVCVTDRENERTRKKYGEEEINSRIKAI